MGKYHKSQSDKKVTKIFTIREQCPKSPLFEIKVTVLSEGGKIWIQPQGYGDKCSADGAGWPIAIEIWQERLRLIVFADINEEEPQIIDMENAKELSRLTKPV